MTSGGATSPSLLSRARNSTINLASLATGATGRFSCSASVGNLWHLHLNPNGATAIHQNYPSSDDDETNNLESGGIRAIDYVTRGTFDNYQESHNTRASQDTEGTGQKHQLITSKSTNCSMSPLMSTITTSASTTNTCEHITNKDSKQQQSVKSSSSNKLFSMATTACAPTSSRKLSTKEKSKKHKDAERIEKLRLLVSYLKEGTTQPVLSPVALEADDIELAERYKLHMLIRDHELLCNGNEEHTNCKSSPKTPQQPQRFMLNSLANSAEPNAKMANSCSSNQVQLLDVGPGNQMRFKQQQKHHQQQASSDYNLTTNSNHQCSITAAPVSVMAINSSLATTTDTRTTTTTSSSYQFGPASHSAGSSSSSMHETHSTSGVGRSMVPHIGTVSWALRHSVSDPGYNQHDHNSSTPIFDQHVHNHHIHDDHHAHEHSVHHNHCEGHLNEHQLDQNNHDQSGASNYLGCTNDGCGPCCAVPSGTPSSSYSSSMSGIGAICYQAIATTPALSSSMQHQQSMAFKQQPYSSKLFYIDDSELQNHSPTSPRAIATSKCDTLTCSSSLSQPATPAILNSSKSGSAIGGDRATVSKTTSSARSGSAWTNPQNLATWIDNEVNSLVHDLEAKSSQLNIKSEKPAKSGKRRWLSVRRGRRNSSGAHST